jgi:two-component sensor histidine kinase
VCQTARQAFAPDVQVVAEACSGVLSNDVAMPLALIINELLTNAVKHGLGGRLEGVIRVGLTNDGDSLQLYVEDDGPGFDLETVRERASGLRLVRGLARQIGGRFDVVRSSVTRCIVRFSQDHDCAHRTKG